MNKFGKLLQEGHRAKDAAPERPRKGRAKAPAGPPPTITETQEIRVTRPVGKRSKGEYTQVSAYVPRDTHRRVKAALLTDDDERDFSELVSDLLAEWLDTRGAA